MRNKKKRRSNRTEIHLIYMKREKKKAKNHQHVTLKRNNNKKKIENKNYIYGICKTIEQSFEHAINCSFTI